MRLPRWLGTGGVVIPSFERFFWNVMIFFLVGVLFSRGLIETVLPKSVAMVFQLGVVVASLALLFICHINAFTRRQQFFLILCLGFTGVIGLSALMTTLVQDFHYWGIYAIFNLYLLWVAVGSIRLIRAPIPPIAFHRIFLFWGWVLFAVSCLEQAHLVTMPGYSFVGRLIRSSSLMGSFLHYPIVMALTSYIVLQWGVKARDRFYIASGVVFALAPILVLSRSGAFIVLFAVCIAWFNSLLRAERTALWISLFIGVALFGAVGSSNGKADGGFLDRAVERIVNATSKKSAGNEGRIHAWKEATGMWLDSNLLIGEYTGTITNSTKNVFKGKSDVAESGVLQQLVNFGFVGLIIFYGLLFTVFSYIRREDRLLRYVYLAGLSQTLFYQSIEVVPFITVMLLMPWISHSLMLQAKGVPDVRRFVLEPS